MTLAEHLNRIIPDSSIIHQDVRDRYSFYSSIFTTVLVSDFAPVHHPAAFSQDPNIPRLIPT